MKKRRLRLVDRKEACSFCGGALTGEPDGGLRFEPAGTAWAADQGGRRPSICGACIRTAKGLLDPEEEAK